MRPANAPPPPALPPYACLRPRMRSISSPFAGRTTKILGLKASFRCSALYECNGDDTVSARVCHQNRGLECSNANGVLLPQACSPCPLTLPVPALIFIVASTERSSSPRLVWTRAPQPQRSDGLEICLTLPSCSMVSQREKGYSQRHVVSTHFIAELEGKCVSVSCCRHYLERIHSWQR
jgi:uncharacterized C2H2 Zn-finger protein